jgi:DNA-binding MarR family transcriptional regulator
MKKFVQVPLELIEDPRLTSKDKIVYMSIKSFCWNSKKCWPSAELIAERINMSRPNIFKHIQKLEELGYLSIKREVNKSNKYEIKV